MLRWAVRGRDLAPFTVRRRTRLLWTHGRDGSPLPRLPPLADALLAASPGCCCSLVPITRAGRRGRCSASRAATAAHRVVWADLARVLRAVSLTRHARHGPAQQLLRGAGEHRPGSGPRGCVAQQQLAPSRGSGRCGARRRGLLPVHSGHRGGATTAAERARGPRSLHHHPARRQRARRASRTSMTSPPDTSRSVRSTAAPSSALWQNVPRIVAEALAPVPDPIVTALRPGEWRTGPEVARAMARLLAPDEARDAAPSVAPPRAGSKLSAVAACDPAPWRRPSRRSRRERQDVRGAGGGNGARAPPAAGLSRAGHAPGTMESHRRCTGPAGS